jgi:hypothetical protein
VIKTNLSAMLRAIFKYVCSSDADISLRSDAIIDMSEEVGGKITAPATEITEGGSKSKINIRT